MTDWLLAQVSDWGAWALAVVTFLSCLALPVPSSMLMLAAGAFAATGDLALAPVMAGALIGALLGDQAGYQLGRLGFQRAEGWVRRSPTRAAIHARASASLQRGGAIAVFLSRWLFSVLGPYVNLAAGAAGMSWLVFSLAGTAGEVVWVLAYIGLGYLAGGQLSQASEMLSNALGLAGSLTVTLGLGWMLVQRRRKRRALIQQG